MDKEYYINASNVIDMSKVYKDNKLQYWTNTTGEVNMPGDVGIVLHDETELPPPVREIYNKIECEVNPADEYVVSLGTQIGVLLEFVLTKWWIGDLFGIEHDDSTMDAIENRLGRKLKEFCSTWSEEIKEIDANCEVLLGIDTNPDGIEVCVFVPAYEFGHRIDNNLTSVREKVNEIAYSEPIQECLRECLREIYSDISTKKKEAEKIFTPPYNSTYGIWDVSTEEDVNGGRKSLGIYEGYIDDIALTLADKAFYCLQFCPIVPKKVQEGVATRKSVEICFDWKSPVSSRKPQEYKNAMSCLFADRPVDVDKGCRSGCVTITKTE